MRKWWPLVAICLGTFMLLVDVTIVNVALPAMADSLNTSFSSLQWVIDAYALALAALLLGSRVGGRPRRPSQVLHRRPAGLRAVLAGLRAGSRMPGC